MQARVVGKGLVGTAERLADARSRRGVARIVAGKRGQDGRGVLHRAAEHARPIARERGRHQAGAADQAMRGDNPHETAVSSWIARRGTGLLAKRAYHQVGRNGGARAAAGAAGAAAGVVRIARGATEGRAVAGSVFAHVGLGEDDCARLAQPRHHLGVARRAVVGVIRRRSAGGAHVEGVELILDRERNAVQRPLETAGAGELGVERPRLFERVGHVGIAVGGIGLRALATQVEGDERIDLASVLDRLDIAELKASGGIDRTLHAGAVIGGDAFEVLVDQLGRGELTRQHRAVHVGDGRFLRLEGPSLRSPRKRRQQAQD